jgi:DNA-binding Xre family transcriptional regulator
MDVESLISSIEAEVGGKESLSEARQWASDLLWGNDVTLQKLRLSRGLSQAQLAAALGTHQPNIARMEGGDIRSPGLDTLNKLCEVLEVDLNTLGAAFGNVRARR